MKRLALGVGLGLLLFAAAAGGVLWWGLAGSLPDAPAVRTETAVEAALSIRYDPWRRPYVEAASLGDALFAEGWLHARERLWQMELLRRAGRGRMAEVLGGGLLATDRQLWRAGVPQLGRVLQANASGFLREQVRRYVAGVNAGRESLGRRPPEFLLAGFSPSAWTPADVYAVGALVAYQAANNQNNELLRLALAAELDASRFRSFLPDEAGDADTDVAAAGAVARGVIGALSAQDALSTLDAPLLASAGMGSNGWVLSPGRSTTGRALFAFDSHDDLALPNLFFEVHLFFPPDRQLRGWSVAGLPGVINGYNEALAWGLTNIGDTQDLFIEDRHPQDPLKLRGPDGWYPVRTERVEIPVAGRREPEELDIHYSRHGPLIHDDPAIALRWTGHDVGALGMDAFLAMNLARDWMSFSAAADRLPAPTSNVTYADRTGTIALRSIGLLPRRRSGLGLVPQSGADADSGWHGYVPMDELPRRVNPPSGYLAAANARVVQPGDVLVSADNAPGYRMRRLRQVLGGSARFSLDDMQRLQTDWYNAQAALLLPALLPVLEDLALDGHELAAAELLRDWAADPVNARELAAPLIYETFYVALADALFASQLSGDLLARLKSNNYVLNHALDRLVLHDPTSPWWRGSRADVIGAAFRAAVAQTRRALGGTPGQWRWDARQSVLLRHELADAIPLLGQRLLDRGPFAWGGGPTTLGRARYRYRQPFLARAGATVRVVAELGARLEVRSIIPGGQSGHPLSAHYADQLPDWLGGALHSLPPAPDAVAGSVDRLNP